VFEPRGGRHRGQCIFRGEGPQHFHFQLGKTVRSAATTPAQAGSVFEVTALFAGSDRLFPAWELHAVCRSVRAQTSQRCMRNTQSTGQESLLSCVSLRSATAVFKTPAFRRQVRPKAW
jgi:hypothetical protein